MPGYSIREDSENIFGSDNIRQWADLNNREHTDEIDARINWAISQAYANINGRLKNGPYSVPFQEPVDENIVQLSAKLVGVLLYDGRNLVDTDEYDQIAPHRKRIRETISGIHGGLIKLNHPDRVIRYPQSIKF
jgi:phage gp36-like protein